VIDTSSSSLVSGSGIESLAMLPAERARARSTSRRMPWLAPTGS
jgi:hypothetical protein